MAGSNKKSHFSPNLNTDEREEREKMQTKQINRRLQQPGIQSLPPWLVVALSIAGALLLFYAFYQLKLVEKSSHPRTHKEIIQQ